VYEVLFEGANLFHHSNWRLPYRIEKALSWIIVTPRMHGVHHSIVKRETDSNYSVIFNCWDRLHRSIRLNIPQEQINIGVPSYRDPGEQSIKNLLLMPIRRPRPWQLPDGSIPERKHEQNKSSLEP
jgi:sterol desaturase/sphingolipid hydroxylase (fatty acid hydroxylase superfamily)